LLNEYYYGKGNGTSNENGKAYCYGYYNSTYQPIPDCNFNEIGISNSKEDYFGTMIENVYWNTGKSSFSGKPGDLYETETATQTVSGYIGLMAASDYGYAGINYNEMMDGTEFAYNTSTNWLYGNGYEWTSIESTVATYATIRISADGTSNDRKVYVGYSVRPTVYLNSSVYILSGIGTERDPIIIGM